MPPMRAVAHLHILNRGNFLATGAVGVCSQDWFLPAVQIHLRYSWPYPTSGLCPSCHLWPFALSFRHLRHFLTRRTQVIRRQDWRLALWATDAEGPDIGCCMTGISLLLGLWVGNAQALRRIPSSLVPGVATSSLCPDYFACFLSCLWPSPPAQQMDHRRQMETPSAGIAAMVADILAVAVATVVETSHLCHGHRHPERVLGVEQDFLSPIGVLGLGPCLGRGSFYLPLVN